MATGSASDYAVEAAQLEAKVLDLKHNHGLTFQAIADQLGLSKPYVNRVFWRAVRRLPDQLADDYRRDQLARIAARREVAQEIMTGDHPLVQQGRIVYPVTGRNDEGKPVYGDEPLLDDGPRLAAIAQLRAEDDQEAKLLGLYAAAKVSQDVTVNYTVGGGVDPETDLK